MRPRPAGAAVTGLAVALLALAGCTSAPDAEPVEDAAPASPTAAAPPTPAGSSEAAAVSGLPEGAASGTALLAYTGVGELDEPFTGECTRDGDATAVTGSADTASIRLEIAPGGARLVLEDVGFSATSDLATGRYDVDGGHLSLEAPLTQEQQVVGSVRLEVDCGR